MSKAAKTAIGGMTVALSTVILLPTVLEVFVYALPAFAGILTLFCVIELGRTWAFGVYAATSIVSFIVIPNKEAVIFYIAFFGYYPILKSVLESKLPKAIEYILKFAVFNLSVVAACFLTMKLMGLSFNELMGIEEGSASVLAKYGMPIMLGLGNIAFIFFDIMLTRCAIIYIKIIQKKFHKMFRFK